MSTTHQQEFTMRNGRKITFSVFEQRLLFIHSDFTSSQLGLDDFGIEVTNNIETIKLGFWFTLTKKDGTPSDQFLSFYFALEEFKPLQKYFRALGYPVPEYPTITKEDLTNG